MTTKKILNDNEILIEVRERLILIEEHLRNMNGKLYDHNKQLTIDCPQKHLDIERFITETKIMMKINIMIGSTLIIAALGYIINKFFPLLNHI